MLLLLIAYPAQITTIKDRMNRKKLYGRKPSFSYTNSSGSFKSKGKAIIRRLYGYRYISNYIQLQEDFLLFKNFEV